MSESGSRRVLLQDKAPVVLVPGIGLDYAMWNWKRVLEREGYVVKIAKLYKTFVSFKTVQEQVDILSETVERVLKDSNVEKCNLIGFSMGSVVSLYYLQSMRGYQMVDKCICAIGPFWGTRRYLLLLAYLAPLVRGLSQIFPGSALLQDIISFGKLNDTKIYTVRGQYDLLCSERSGRLPFAKNLDPLLTGHIGIYCALSKEAIKYVLDILDE